MTPTIRLTRRVAFHARHRMALPGWSDAEAEKRFGWTASQPGHGHLYRVAITVGGRPDPETGVVVDLLALDAVIDQEVCVPLSGHDLNQVIESVAAGRAVPSCETLAAEIWTRVSQALPAGVTLERVLVQEDDTLEAECTAQ